MTKNESLMEFPCDFLIKIIGKNSPEFAADVANIICKHFPNTADCSNKSHISQQGNYLSISVTVHAHNQASLDALYIELTKHPDIKMVL